MSRWIAVALSADLEPGTSTGTKIDGAEVVVWRDAAGAAHAWEDRCPHRGMRMSFGFVRGDRIACLYHGWAYDTEGRCRAIPAHPDLEVPRTIRIPRYPVAEACGIVWVWPEMDGDPTQPPPASEPAVPVRSVYVETDAATVLRLMESSPPPDWGVHDRPFFAVQPIDAGRAAIHMTLLGTPAHYGADARSHFARHLETIRRLAAPAEAA